jgi:hypothetical protein
MGSSRNGELMDRPATNHELVMALTPGAVQLIMSGILPMRLQRELLDALYKVGKEQRLSKGLDLKT